MYSKYARIFVKGRCVAMCVWDNRIHSCVRWKIVSSSGQPKERLSGTKLKTSTYRLRLLKFFMRSCE